MQFQTRMMDITILPFIVLFIAGIIVAILIIKRRKNKIDNIEEFRPRNEEELIGKITKMMRVSSRIRLDVMREGLNLDSKAFNTKLFDWANEFGFKIDGDYIVVEDADIEGFISSLDKQFDMWENKEKGKEGKK